MTGSHHSAKESKSLPAEHIRGKMINYGGSNSCYQTIYIPLSSIKNRRGGTLELHPDSFLTSLRPPAALFPAASCLHVYSKQSREGERANKTEVQGIQRRRGTGCRKEWLHSCLTVTVCTQWRSETMGLNELIRSWVGDHLWKIVFMNQREFHNN